MFTYFPEKQDKNWLMKEIVAT